MTETSFGNRISQTFPNTVVTWELEKIDNDKTRLKLSNIGFNAGEIAKKHDEGWSHFLNELTKYCQAVRYSH
ncbi:MAG: SRPBCC domain-containing protein [Nitrososphaeraceae archaeon]